MKQFLAFFLILSFPLFSEDDPTQRVIKATITPNSISMNHGGNSKIKVNLKIEKGYHIYISKKVATSKNVITTFSSSETGFSLLVSNIPKGDNTSDKENIILKNSGDFDLEIFDISEKPRTLSGNIKIDLLTQVCDDKMICFQPTTISYDLKVDLKGQKQVSSSFKRNVSAASTIAWLTSYKDAVAKAKSKGLNVYAVVTAPAWCGACRILENETFPDKKVSEMLNKSFIPLYIDYDTSADRSNFKTNGVPGNFIIDENGKQIYAQAGAYRADGFLQVFKAYAKTAKEDKPTPAPLPPNFDENSDQIPKPPDLEDNKNSSNELEKINSEFDEGGRYKVRKVNIERKGNVFTTDKGGVVRVSMEIKHDCSFCGNSVNQIIVGLGGENSAQESVWNGKQRSGGELKTVNTDNENAAFAEDNAGEAQWVQVFFKLKIPEKKGTYYLRTRYAQDYKGRVMTKAGLLQKQPHYTKVLGWWKVDRPNGPDSSSNIGAVIVK